MAGLVLVVVSEDGNMADEDATLGLPEGGVLQFLLDEFCFLGPQLGEVVEACIFLMVVRLVLATVQYHEAGVAPTDAAVCFSLSISSSMVVDFPMTTFVSIFTPRLSTLATSLATTLSFGRRNSGIP